MQKRKTQKDSNVRQFRPENLTSVFFEDIINEFAAQNMDADHRMDQMMQAIPVVMNAATKLSKLVVENRVRNGDNMTDDDIYKIYKKSFLIMMEESA